MALPARHRVHVRRGTTFMLGVAATALVTIPSTYFCTRASNTAMVAQQQQLVELQAFENTGGALDTAVQQFSDALVDGSGISTARKGLRSAVSAHASAAFVLRDAMGNSYDRYASQLSRIRSLADSASNPQEGVGVFQAVADLISMRRSMAQRIRAQAT